MILYPNSAEETEKAGARLVCSLQPGSVVALFGDLGAGKTAFVRGIASGLGLDSRVSSPTFTIVNEYLGPTPLFHFDMYRIKDSDELFDIGWEDYLDRNGICALEWSERVEGAIGPEAVRVTLRRLDDTHREIVISRKEGEAC